MRPYLTVNRPVCCARGSCFMHQLCQMWGEAPALAVGWRGWRLRKMRRLRFFIHHLMHRFSQRLEAGNHVTQFSQSHARALAFLEALTPYAYESVPKFPSVIQPGRRWDSPTKLTSPIFLHTFSENHGIFQVESGSGGLSRYIWLFITCRRRWTWAHGKTALRGRLKRGSLENNGRLCSMYPANCSCDG